MVEYEQIKYMYFKGKENLMYYLILLQNSNKLREKQLI